MMRDVMERGVGELVPANTRASASYSTGRLQERARLLGHEHRPYHDRKDKRQRW